MTWLRDSNTHYNGKLGEKVVDFKFKHNKTGEIRTLTLTEEEMAELISVDILYGEFFFREYENKPLKEISSEKRCYLNNFELFLEKKGTSGGQSPKDKSLGKQHY